MSLRSTSAGIGPIRSLREIFQTRRYSEAHFVGIDALDLSFEPGDMYRKLMGIADLQIITDPFTVAVYLEKLLIANGIFANQESIENALKRIAADPIGCYSDIYFIGTYLSACINAHIHLNDRFRDITEFADALHTWFDALPSSDLRGHPENIGKLRQALPILFINVAKLFFDRGDFASAKSWYMHAYKAACKLGTRQFAFLALQEYSLLVSQSASITPTVLGSDPLSTDMPMDWGQLANLRVWADRWYDARITATIVNSSEIKSMQQRKTRNVNKLRIAELNHEGVLLLREHLSRAHDISRRAHDILIIGKTRQSIDEDELFGSLLTYVERVRAIKAEFLAYQKTREKASFLDTDMAGIAVCELTICRIINAYEEWGHISFLLARYRNPLFWAPRALIDDDYRVADLKDDPPPNNVHHLGETTVLNAVRGLDQRYLWMQVYNALSHAKMIRPDEGSACSILRKIAIDIAGIDQYAAKTLSEFFLASSAHPIVSDFIEHLVCIKLPGGDSVSNTSVHHEDTHGHTIILTSLGIYLKDLLQGHSRFENVEEYFNTEYGVGNWSIQYDGEFYFGSVERDLTQNDKDQKGIVITLRDGGSVDMDEGRTRWLQWAIMHKAQIAPPNRTNEVGTARESRPEQIRAIQNQIFNIYQDMTGDVWIMQLMESLHWDHRYTASQLHTLLSTVFNGPDTRVHAGYLREGMTNDPPTITAFAKDIEILQNFLRYLQGWESGNLLDQRIREILPGLASEARGEVHRALVSRSASIKRYVQLAHDGLVALCDALRQN